MSSGARGVSAPAGTFQFYSVSAKTYPFTEDTRILIGNYSSQKVALAAAEIIRENNMQKLPGGIDVFCDCFANPLTDSNQGIYKKEIDLDERNRLLSMGFKDITRKRKKKETSSQEDADDEKERVSSKLQKTTHAPEAYITSSFNPEIAGQNFTNGVLSAQIYAQECYGSNAQKIKITFHGSGICAMAAGPRAVDPIELQEITLVIDTDDNDDIPAYHNIGKVLPEKDHLFTLKTSSEIADEIKALIDQFFKQNPDLVG